MSMRSTMISVNAEAESLNVATVWNPVVVSAEIA
jgi:hypothetical protein